MCQCWCVCASELVASHSNERAKRKWEKHTRTRTHTPKTNAVWKDGRHTNKNREHAPAHSNEWLCIKVKKLHYRKRQYQVFILQLSHDYPASPFSRIPWTHFLFTLFSSKFFTSKNSRILSVKYQNAIVLFNLLELINNAWPNNIKSNFACILTVSLGSCLSLVLWNVSIIHKINANGVSPVLFPPSLGLQYDTVAFFIYTHLKDAKL